MTGKIKRVFFLIGAFAMVSVIAGLISLNSRFHNEVNRTPDLRCYSTVYLTFDSLTGHMKCDILYDPKDPSYGLGLVITNETDTAIEIGQTGKLYFWDSLDNTFSELKPSCDNIEEDLLGLFTIEPGQTRDSFYIPNINCVTLKGGRYRMVFDGNWVTGSKEEVEAIKLNVDFDI